MYLTSWRHNSAAMYSPWHMLLETRGWRFVFHDKAPDPIDMTNPEVCLECDKSLFGKVAEKTVLLSPASVNASIRTLSIPLPSNTIDMLGLCFRYPMICLNIDSCPFIGSLAARLARRKVDEIWTRIAWKPCDLSYDRLILFDLSFIAFYALMWLEFVKSLSPV